MSYVMMMAPVHLHVGCPLDYLGKRVEFLRYAEVLVGPLDPMGRRPGRYVDRHSVIVKYSDGELKAPTKDIDFAGTYPKPPAAHIQNGVGEVERLGDLPYPIGLWPGDRIKDYGRNKEWFTVAAISFDDDGKPVYELWNDTGLVKLILHFKPSGGWLDRGNIYHLYNDPENLKFGSDEEELVFWSQEGIGVCGLGYGNSGHTLWACADSFRKGHADVILQAEPSREWYRAYKLHDIFAQRRNYVRAFTERLYGARMDAEIAYVAEVARELSQSE